ncbi:50S ribosomal protein L31e [Fonticula alba]|uniref:50S ribosomal protein L31e n=1 Tax=Fonticula alba TaxID=691883 RepID=A0A058ZF13_FONAL|nr:50S ribosomal protein L31e [Fonticula alba]KCV72523.1 50S ribosomal protein L31e [Fonticula alba]|eukprot:XP_009492224.1 50S ribosomal protein L31e [Fonticula alba]
MVKQNTTKTLDEVVTRDYTVNLHKAIHGKSFKKRAPTAIKHIRKFATMHMGTTDVRIDLSLNNAVWNNGIRNVPKRMRIRLARLRNDDANATEKLYTVASFVPVPGNLTKSNRGAQAQTSVVSNE